MRPAGASCAPSHLPRQSLLSSDSWRRPPLSSPCACSSAAPSPTTGDVTRPRDAHPRFGRSVRASQRGQGQRQGARAAAGNYSSLLVSTPLAPCRRLDLGRLSADRRRRVRPCALGSRPACLFARPAAHPALTACPRAQPGFKSSARADARLTPARSVDSDDSTCARASSAAQGRVMRGVVVRRLAASADNRPGPLAPAALASTKPQTRGPGGRRRVVPRARERAKGQRKVATPTSNWLMTDERPVASATAAAVPPTVRCPRWGSYDARRRPRPLTDRPAGRSPPEDDLPPCAGGR